MHRGKKPLLLLFLLPCWVCALAPAYAQSGPMPPSGLLGEYLVNPLGIDVAQPRLSWVLEHTERAQKQTAYEVLVATKLEVLERDRGDQWDSGKVASEESVQVVYNGKALESSHTYYWKVRYWDAQGNPSPYSKPATFEMGLLSREEWKGQWITGANQLRTEFQLAEALANARVYICGLGYYELRINGAKVGHNVLDPAWTTYDKRVLYTTYDVTAQLHRGANALGVMLGNGWFSYGRQQQPPVLLFQMDIELASGKRLSVVSGPSWKGKNGPITSDSVWDGEVYDARLGTAGWDSPGFDDSGWKAAQSVDGPKGVLSAGMMPPIRVVDTLVPVGVTNPRPGVYVFDMGQNFAGWAQLRVRGPRGATVTLRFAELIHSNGMINRENLRAAKARDVYTLRGEGLETYEPRFTYHGFRYVEVSGFPGTPGLDSIRGRVAHSAVKSIGSFAASNPLLNQIQRLIYWGQLSNLYGVPTDCDQRNERMGWMGDAHVTAEEAMLNFDMAAFYSNFVRDIRDNQSPDGSVTDTVPHGYGAGAADPAWGTAYPLICWYMWEQYGDRRILEENYEGLKKWVEWMRSKATDNILTYSKYGDWVAVEPTPGSFVSALYYLYDVQIEAKIAGVLGKREDAQSYGQLAAQITEAINNKFWDASTGSYANGTQTANAMALFMGVVPPNRRSVTGKLTNDIVYRHDTHVTTGFIGVKYLLPVLTQMGRSDLAYDLATQTTYPSWGYMIAQGATTLWELWQEKTGPSMNSHNHIMFGSVGAWFYQALGGINIEPDAPGYKRIGIQPQMVRDLASASASVETLRGTVSSSWTHSPGVVTLDIVVPVGSEADVVIPKDDEMTDVTLREGNQVVWEKGHFVPGASGITSATTRGRDLMFKAGSGRYSFRLTGQ